MDAANATTPASTVTSTDTSATVSSTMSVTPSTLATGKTTPGVGKATPTSTVLQKRRSSTRSIKRKKFDDELVESSLAKTDRSRSRLTSTTTTVPSSSNSSTCLTPVSSTILPVSATPSASLGIDVRPVLASEASVTPNSVTVAPLMATAHQTNTQNTVIPASTTTVSSTEVIPSTAMTSATPAEKKKSKSSSKRSKKSKPPAAGSTKDLGRWKPQDDLLLINGVQQTCDLSAVFHGVKFSCKFTLKEIQERWYALMYDSVLSKLAIQAMKQLHPDVIAEINTQALYSKAEEDILKSITSSSQPTLDVFQECLSKNPTVFHAGRTAKSLHNHWLLLKQYHLLPDQSVPPMPKGDHVLNFSDAEDMINDDELREAKNEILEQELKTADRRHKREIRHLEEELPKWQVLVDSVTGISPPDFDNQTLAVLRGRLVRYLMRSREITLGRATKDNQIDVDLSLEGPAWKISRRQGLIKLKSNGEFYLLNEGRRPVYIDGKPVLMGSKQKLNNNSVVEISCLRFIFLINLDLINIIRQESQK